ncbi:hypothetical protein DCAR_0414935 [Daucus carota subsp. sativus]|uniref:Response regulatory domain-containing protein n=1 Tax=Daucus carota subsp. sativus TaxID=79200 RepID=A0A162A849_DAUCS|nr:hypothetical protein DCAR_0414935 [Daucus carota subsp. sativus]
MYNVLVVDDDRTCLYILKACLEKWNYEVTIVKDAHEALSMLQNKSFDLVITDVHMPKMDGLKLQERINQDFNLPVILISADSRAEVMCMGINNGAQRFFVKPIVEDDLKDIWQFIEWGKRNRNNNTIRGTQINESSEESRTVIDSHKDNDNTTGKRREKLVWTCELHSRFVEAILIIGYHRAVPANILGVMNVEGLTRGHIASHLQKYQKFLERVLAGEKNIEFSNWTDLNYYSSFVKGNPNLVLLNLLRDEQMKGNLAAQNPLRLQKEGTSARAPNGSSSSFHPLPQLTLVRSSSRTIYETFRQKNYCSENVASCGLRSATSPILGNKHRDPGMDISLCANQFGNTSTMNAHELGGENLTDESWFNNIGREDDNDYSLNIENDEDVDANKDLNPEGDL